MKSETTELKTVEGRDYTLDAGRLVFTAEYLCARGTCCHSGCRNCPYSRSQVNRNESSAVAWISFVPSWTETLFAAGADLIGRTRFCIHPKDGMASVPVVGGTKNLLVSALTQVLQKAAADKKTVVVVLDREENPRGFLDQMKSIERSIPSLRLIIVDTHVTGLNALDQGFMALSEQARSVDEEGVARALEAMGSRLKQALARLERDRAGEMTALEGGKGQIERPSANQIRPAVYLVWRKPWIAVARNTFIAEMVWALHRVTLFPDPPIESSKDRYPQLSDEDLREVHTSVGSAEIWLSSEPYDFKGRFIDAQAELSALGLEKILLVDGEIYSWFGLRALRALEDSYLAK